MRIALDATYGVDDRPSGIGRYSLELLRDLPALYPEDHFLACLRPKQWRRWRTPARPNVSPRLLQWPLPLGRPDLFHALNQRVDWRPARRVISTFHDLFVMTAEYSTPEFRRRFTQQAREAATRSDLVITVSEFTATQVQDLLHVERSRIRVIPHGVHQITFDTGIAREPMILFVGALQRRKNVLRLVEAYEHMPPEWTLTLAGSISGYGSSEIAARIAASPRAHQIKVTGYIPEAQLQHCYARASIFAFPSLDEGFGMPILEAMRSGVPVLTSAQSATAEVAGAAAVLVNPTDQEALTQELLQLTRNQDLRSSLITMGHARARCFPWSRAIHETYRVYQELLN